VRRDMSCERGRSRPLVRRDMSCERGRSRPLLEHQMLGVALQTGKPYSATLHESHNATTALTLTFVRKARSPLCRRCG
jgi:hypothetical protein